MNVEILVFQLILIGLFSAWCTLVFDAICETFKSGKKDNL